MPEFTNPFIGMVPRKMTHGELARAIMLNISAEYEAVHLYLAHMDATDNEEARKVLYDIALEELVHAGEFTSLLFRLDPVVAIKAQEGFAEVRELLASKAPAELASTEREAGSGQAAGPAVAPAAHLTIGSLIGMQPRRG